MSDADAGPPLIPKPIAQALLDSLLGTTLVQTLLTGFYVVLFAQTVVPLLRDGKRRVYAGVLMLLFSMVIINLGTTWQILRDIMISHNDTRNTMVLELMGGPLQIPLAANATGCIAVLIADTLLVWRCYVLWGRNKLLLAFFTLLLLGEVALIPILLVLNANLGPGKVSIICLFFFLSIGITVLATGLIIYRISDVAKRSRGETSRYQYAMEVLVESGAMYSLTLLISGVLLAVRGNDFDNYPLVQASSYWGGILTPITGIAPTLISMRIVSGTARDETTWSQPVSGFVFKTTPLSDATGQTSTFHGSETALKNFNAAHNASDSEKAASSVERKPSNDSLNANESEMVFRKEVFAVQPGTAV